MKIHNLHFLPENAAATGVLLQETQCIKEHNIRYYNISYDRESLVIFRNFILTLHFYWSNFGHPICLFPYL